MSNPFHIGFIYRHTEGGHATEGLFGQYDLGIEVGKVSFATVRKAVHKPSGKWYAVKMIYPSKSVGQQESRNKNLIREISIMEKLDHHNVCKLVEVFFQNDNSICTFSLSFAVRIYIQSLYLGLVLELVEGGDLLDHIIKTSGLCKPSLFCPSLTYSDTTFISGNRRTGYHIPNVQCISRKSEQF
jgi:serine/threonine/tyrosine protein kinase RAD53